MLDSGETSKLTFAQHLVESLTSERGRTGDNSGKSVTSSMRKEIGFLKTRKETTWYVVFVVEHSKDMITSFQCLALLDGSWYNCY